MLRPLVLAAVVMSVAAAGPSDTDSTLTDPIVIPNPLAAPMAGTTGFGAQVPSERRTIGGYPVSIAWDHVLVGAAILGVMFIFGESESAAGTF